MPKTHANAGAIQRELKKKLETKKPIACSQNPKGEK